MSRCRATRGRTCGARRCSPCVIVRAAGWCRIARPITASVRALPATVAAALGLTASGRQPAFHWVEHHPAHLASAFFVSPFDDAAVCAIDGFGDFVSTSWAVGRGSSLDVVHRTFFPHSLGLLYLAITQYLGFMRYGDEFKVMGLAPYGERRLRRRRSSSWCSGGPAAISSSTSRYFTPLVRGRAA